MGMVDLKFFKVKKINILFPWNHLLMSLSIGTHGHFISNFVKNFIASYFTKPELYSENKEVTYSNNNNVIYLLNFQLTQQCFKCLFDYVYFLSFSLLIYLYKKYKKCFVPTITPWLKKFIKKPISNLNSLNTN